MEKKEKKPELPLVPPSFVPFNGSVMPWFPSFTDPQGSWTGKPEETDEIPVQDADDL